MHKGIEAGVLDSKFLWVTRHRDTFSTDFFAGFSLGECIGRVNCLFQQTYRAEILEISTDSVRSAERLRRLAFWTVTFPQLAVDCPIKRLGRSV